MKPRTERRFNPLPTIHITEGETTAEDLVTIKRLAQQGCLCTGPEMKGLIIDNETILCTSCQARYLTNGLKSLAQKTRV